MLKGWKVPSNERFSCGDSSLPLFIGLSDSRHLASQKIIHKRKYFSERDNTLKNNQAISKFKISTKSLAAVSLLCAISIILARIFGILVPIAGFPALKLNFALLPLLIAGIYCFVYSRSFALLFKRRDTRNS